MIRRIKILLSVLAGLGAFTSGSVLACDGQYCTPVVLDECVTLEELSSASCCLNLDANGKKCWTCDREKYLCELNGRQYDEFGPAFNCHSPGSACN